MKNHCNSKSKADQSAVTKNFLADFYRKEYMGKTSSSVEN